MVIVLTLLIFFRRLFECAHNEYNTIKCAHNEYNAINCAHNEYNAINCAHNKYNAINCALNEYNAINYAQIQYVTVHDVTVRDSTWKCSYCAQIHYVAVPIRDSMLQYVYVTVPITILRFSKPKCVWVRVDYFSISNICFSAVCLQFLSFFQDA